MPEKNIPEKNIKEKTTLLIVDDEPHQRTILSRFFTDLGFHALEAGSAKEAFRVLQESATPVRIVITDLSMPEVDGIELMKKARGLSPELDFIIVTAHGTIETAVKALKAGAYDYLLKPIELDDLELKVKKLMELRSLEKRAETLEAENKNLRIEVKPVAKSKQMKALLSDVQKVSQTQATVLLEGETGVGKEVIARYIHESSSRKDGPFVAVNCSAIPENLLESEFFGHEKGSFTGAEKRTNGYFGVAEGGTLFLDEIGEMELKLQAKILRAIEEKKIKRVGGSTESTVDIRIIAATHRNLKLLVSEGKFREDLFYRLNVIRFQIPPLRERREDISELLSQLIARFSKSLGVKVNRVEDAYLEGLMIDPFPGNIRELANRVERSLIYMNGGVLTGAGSAPIGAPIAGSSSVPKMEFSLGQPLSQIMEEFEKRVLQKSLEEAGGDVDSAAKNVQVSRSTFYAKLSKYGIHA